MAIAKSYEAGMCNLCCAKVLSVFEEVREFVTNAGMDWDEDEWLRKLIKTSGKDWGFLRPQIRHLTICTVFFGEL